MSLNNRLAVITFEGFMAALDAAETKGSIDPATKFAIIMTAAESSRRWYAGEEFEGKTASEFISTDKNFDMVNKMYPETPNHA